MDYIRIIITHAVVMAVLITGTCYAFNDPYVEWDSTRINVNGAMVFTPGSFIQWGDGSVLSSISGLTCTSTAGPVGPVGPKGDSGDTGPAGPPGSAYLTSAVQTIVTNLKLTITDFKNLWLTQGNMWTSFDPSFEKSFLKNLNDSIIRLNWSDTVGIYNNSWCNVGLFLDDSITPICSGSWSGIAKTTIYNQQHFHCTVANIPAGEHVLRVKHRSQYCNYGNYAFDEFGLNRFISIEENINAN